MAQTWLEKYSTYEDEVTGALTGITAHAGGGQASATQLTAKFNTITTVASINDSVKLPTAIVGKTVYVLNGGANTVRVYCTSGDYVNGTLNGYVDAGGSYIGAAIAVCILDGYWSINVL